MITFPYGIAEPSFPVEFHVYTSTGEKDVKKPWCPANVHRNIWWVKTLVPKYPKTAGIAGWLFPQLVIS